MWTKNSVKRVYIIGAVVLLLTAAGIFAGRYIGRRCYSVMLVGVGIVTFCGFLRPDERSRVDEGSMRSAVAASLLMTYVVLLGTVAFWVEVPADKGTQLPELSKTMIGHFTTIVGIVIAFYFGSTAYSEVKRKQRGGSMSELQSEREK